MLQIRAVLRFIWLAVRPISKAESYLGIVELVNLLPYSLLTIPEMRDWVATWWSTYWLLGICIFLALFAGIKLQFQSMPRLEIVYDLKKFPKCRDILSGQITFRVGVMARGSKSIYDVHVVLSEMYPLRGGASSPVLPQELNPSTHQPGTPSGKFALNPNEAPTFVNVANWSLGQEISIFYQENYKYKEAPKNGEWRRDVPSTLPPDSYDLILEASGRDSPKVTRFFRLEVAEDDFRFYPIKQKPEMHMEDH